MTNKICEFIEAPLCEGSPTVGSELAYKVLKKIYKSNHGHVFTDYVETTRVTNLTDEFGTKNINEVITKCENVRLPVLESFNKGHFPIIVGGDHSVAMASIAACSETFGIDDLAVIYIDGHADINTEVTSISHNIHGMPLASSLGLCERQLQVGPLHKKIHGNNLFILGARSIDEQEFEIINSNGVHLFSNKALNIIDRIHILNDLVSLIGNKKVHVSFDVDVLDPSCFASTGYLMPNGLSIEELYEIINFIFDKMSVVSIDVVEYNPSLDKTGKDAAKLIDFIKQIEKCAL